MIQQLSDPVVADRCGVAPAGPSCGSSQARCPTRHRHAVAHPAWNHRPRPAPSAAGPLAARLVVELSRCSHAVQSPLLDQHPPRDSGRFKPGRASASPPQHLPLRSPALGNIRRESPRHHRSNRPTEHGIWSSAAAVASSSTAAQLLPAHAGEGFTPCSLCVCAGNDLEELPVIPVGDPDGAGAGGHTKNWSRQIQLTNDPVRPGVNTYQLVRRDRAVPERALV